MKVGGVTHTARQMEVGGVIVTLLGRWRWVGSLSHCSADEGGWGHCHTAWQMKVGGVTHCSADKGGWGDCHTAQKIKVGGVIQ